MSEWLTTGQMIDQLKVGDVAETEEQKSDAFISGKFRNYVTIREDGMIAFCDEKGKHGVFALFNLTEINRNLKWRILPKYVSFEEAIKALKEGKEVNFIANNNYTYRIIPNMHFKALENDHIHWKDLLDGRWIIKQ